MLGLDTATGDTCAGACRGRELLTESRTGPADDGRPVHATTALPALEEAASAAGGWGSVGRIAVGLGPGSFTGLRIGIATAQGAGAAAGVPVVGVCTLDALARAAASEAAGRTVVAVIDARRDEVFAAFYGEDGRLGDPFLATPAQLASGLNELSQASLAIGSGALRFRDGLDVRAAIPDDSSALHRVAARHVCALGVSTAATELLEPIYLRPPDAERWHDRNASRKPTN